MQHCTECDADKPVEDFYTDRRSGKPYTKCKPCWRSRYRSAEKVAAYAPRRTEVNRAYREKHGERLRQRDHLRDRRTDHERARHRVEEAARRARIRAAFVDHVDPLVVLEMDDGICGICGTDVDPGDFHVDHIVPLVRGGAHAYENVQASHPVCNLRKGGGRRVPDNRNPRLQSAP